MRLDGELVLADGQAVSWREVVHTMGTRDEVLIKTVEAVALRSARDLWPLPAPTP
jgi:hypothetical protein